jgi:hypothetical protein
MPARIRKLLGLFVVLGFLAAYVAIAVVVADRLPRHWLVQLIFFAVVGVAWGVPLITFFRWMNRGR